VLGVTAGVALIAAFMFRFMLGKDPLQNSNSAPLPGIHLCNNATQPNRILLIAGYGMSFSALGFFALQHPFLYGLFIGGGQARAGPPSPAP
jgi:hypothetical protein